MLALVLLVVMPLSSCGTSSANPCDSKWVSPPSVSLAQRKAARNLALQMPLVRALLNGQPPITVTFEPQGTRQGALIGVQVSIRFHRPAPHVDATWPWLFIDDTGTARPPYQIIRQHVNVQPAWYIAITVLAPTYTTAVVSNLSYGSGGSIVPVPGEHNHLPPQLHCD